jgi:hypothetical protein
MSLLPDHVIPSHLRKHTDAIAKKLHVDVARARASGIADTIIGSKFSGHP